MSTDTGASTSVPQKKPAFEVKKWNAVAMWSWDIEVETCAICRNNLIDPCIECISNAAEGTVPDCTIAWGKCNVCFILVLFLFLFINLFLFHSTLSINIASIVGFKQEMFALLVCFLLFFLSCF